jgi:hypothetical protein
MTFRAVVITQAMFQKFCMLVMLAHFPKVGPCGLARPQGRKTPGSTGMFFPPQIYPDTIRHYTDGKGLHTRIIHHRPATRELIIKLR